MSLDRSLKGKSTLERHRNVLKRSERIVVLEDNEKWHEDSPQVFGLVKVAHRKASAGKKPAKAAETAEGAAVAPGAAAAAPAGKAAAAPAGKAAAAPAAKAKK